MRLRLLALMLAGLPAPERVVPLLEETHHVQGIAMDGTAVWVSAVDREARRCLLFQFDAGSGALLQRTECGDGTRFHPGGIDIDDSSLWVPAAEYKAESSAWIERRDRKNGALLFRFEVKDHIGALTRLSDRLMGASWDARSIYEWTFDGKLIRRRANPTPWRIQDWKYRDGMLVCGAVAPRGSSEHSIVWLDPETLEVRRTLAVGVTDRNVPYTNEGLDVRGGKLYLLPEDGPSRLFGFSLP